MNPTKHPRNPMTLFFGLAALISLMAYVNIVPPSSVPAFLGFTVLVILAVGLLSYYVLRMVHHAVLFTLGVTAFLLLRFFDLRHPLYAILLVASIIALEYLRRENS